MKKIIYIFLALFALASCSANRCKVEGSVTGIADETGVYLLNFDNGRFAECDSTKVSEGKFSFNIEDPYPGMMYIAFKGRRNTLPFISEKGKVSVICDFDSGFDFTVSGTRSNDLLSGFLSRLREYEKSMDSLISENRRFALAGDSLQSERVMLEAETKHSGMMSYRSEFVKKNNNTYTAAFLLSQERIGDMDYREIDSLLNILDPTLPANRFSDVLKARRDMMKNVSVNEVFPDLTLPDPSGEMFTLSSLRGQYVLVDFWASWCDPCRVANPYIVEVYNRYKDRGFTILGVSLDNDKGEWIKAIKDDGLVWHNVSQLKGWESDVCRTYGVVSIPRAFLLDREGRIIESNIHYTKLDEKLGELLPPAE